MNNKSMTERSGSDELFYKLIWQTAFYFIVNARHDRTDI